MTEKEIRTLAAEIVGTDDAPIRPKESFGQAYDRIVKTLTETDGVITLELMKKHYPKVRKNPSKPVAPLLWFRCNSGFEKYGTNREKLREIGDGRISQGLSNGYSISPVNPITGI